MESTDQDTLAAARRMEAYIDAHIREPITAKSLAEVAGYSQYHAARIFKQHTGRMPFEYIRERRLVNAALTLRRDKKKVIDVALDFVFDSHEGFSRAFAKAFGIAPKNFSSLPEPSGWMIPFRVLNRPNRNREERKMAENTAIIFTQIIERPARKLLLKFSQSAEDYFGYCQEFGCADNETGNSIPWEIVSGIKEALYEPVGMWLPENMRPAGTGIYAQGTELPAGYSGAIPDGFAIIDLSPCKLLVFQGEPFDDNDFEQAIVGLWERIEKFNPEVYGYEYADELAPRMQLVPLGWRGYIEMRPVREMAASPQGVKG
ncbi:MAG: AraC family transcriptional regulator [Clostridiales bacterium]|nr:AraC family transcriptional regulator [Clostridiales bacterium]